MGQLDIVHLESYRGRREARYRQAVSLHAGDRAQSIVLAHLWRVASLIGADRCSVVWLDEYGPGLVHPHILLDLATDRPRREFSPTPLRAAWETSVPGLLDLPRLTGHGEKLGSGIASCCAVSLGSDGPRSWFLVADSLTPRQPLGPGVAGELMFLAGEITSLVLHRDLNLRDVANLPGRKGSGTSRSSTAKGQFSGWPVLEDLEGKPPEDELASRIRTRFLLARVVRGMVEDEMVVDPDAVRRQVDLVRLEVDGSDGGNPERVVWERVLQASAAVEPEELAASVQEWGRIVGSYGHLHGAEELLHLAFDLARFCGSSQHALEAARTLGKNLRTGARWEEALAWYRVAEGIAKDLGDSGRRAVVLDGVANTFRDRGNLPQAREVLHEVLEIGRATGNRYAVAIGHHDLMTVEKLSGDLISAIKHGWQAVQSYDSREGSLRALFDLSGVLRESGELGAAKDGYSVVARQVAGFEYRVLALDALALIAALEGDGPAYRSIREKMNEIGWRDLSPVYQGQVLYYLGLSSRALGQEDEEKKWLEEALSYAEMHGLNKLIFDVEEALSWTPRKTEIPAPTRGVPEPFGEKISVVRSGLRELWEAEAVVGPGS